MPDPAYVLIVNILGWIAIGVCCPLALFFSFKDLKKSEDTNKELKELVRS